MRRALVAMLGVVTAGLVAVGSAACGDDAAPGTGSDAGGADGPLAAEIASFIAELCGHYEHCCKDAPSSSDTCASTTEALARGADFDAVRAAACLEGVQAEAKSTDFCIRPPSTSACAAVFKSRNAKAPGTACKQSSDCSSGDDGEGLCILQKCRRAARGKDGDACIGTLIDGKTEPVFGLSTDIGALCSSSEGLYCSEESKNCQKRGAVGAPCSGTDISCVDEAWCPTTTKECAPRTAPNAACEDEYECGLGFRCANDGQGGGACTALEAKGGSCERGDECDPRKGLVCDTDTTKCIEDASLFDQACKGTLALAP
jgi:hypothetical protein